MGWILLIPGKEPLEEKRIAEYKGKVNQFSKTIIGKPEQWLIKAAASIGLDLAGFRHEITDDFKKHVLKRHGNIAIHGKATIVDADFTYIPDIVKAPNLAIIGATRKGCRYIIYTMAVPDMTYIYSEQVFGSHRNLVLRGSTFYKVTRLLVMDDIKRIVTRNDKTDIYGAAIVSLGKA
jgi:hypothetical protein